jgi:hypothetical protein
MERFNTMTNSAIADMIGIKVSVRSNPTGSSDCEDSGILEGYEHPWIRLRKPKGEVICFPIYNIRLIKNLEPLKKLHLDAEEMLLRPVDPVAINSNE